MKIIQPSFEILNLPNREDILRLIELAGRVCYKSEDRIEPGTAGPFVEKIGKIFKHESVLEHSTMTVKFICDRGVSHELVRHRLCSFSQESTRYCSYAKGKFGGEITVIAPPFNNAYQEIAWREGMLACEKVYMDMLGEGASPQVARSVLPNALKTEIVVTANLREWKHIFAMRCSEKAHPQMRELMVPLYARLSQELPEIFMSI
jgi:thymidylate synthase (FAD)